MANHTTQSVGDNTSVLLVCKHLLVDPLQHLLWMKALLRQNLHSK